jgi:hypothetical protein
MFGFSRNKSAAEMLFDLKVAETQALLRRDQEGIREVIAHPAIKRAEEAYGAESVLASAEELRTLGRAWAKARMPTDDGIMWWGVRILPDTTTHSAKEDGA